MNKPTRRGAQKAPDIATALFGERASVLRSIAFQSSIPTPNEYLYCALTLQVLKIGPTCSSMGTKMRNALMISGAAYGCVFGPLGGPLIILYVLALLSIVSGKPIWAHL